LVNDTSGNFATGVNDEGGQFTTVSATPTVHLELQMFKQILGKN
jgi:hypothetical protein